MKNNPQTIPTYEIYRMGAVTRLTGLSRSSIYRLEAANLFPARIKLSASASGWHSKDVHEWISDRPLAAKAKGAK
ncbi:transcriptional regulator, AlpA family [Nitrosospira sp. Nl5]|uniref:helix-turn-helix transcriptional regulator n=1 Tax=Nitrosospira sp. Nl5 TaxID=200120 RepID=UPI0008924637|nr:AlpA family phage regulatory protein [Nitrosospira sp. Nl5]SCY62527.1 transcriptional regulator, AlpA family [Nitrosospira sp. Nl5]